MFPSGQVTVLGVDTRSLARHTPPGERDQITDLLSSVTFADTSVRFPKVSIDDPCAIDPGNGYYLILV